MAWMSWTPWSAWLASMRMIERAWVAFGIDGCAAGRRSQVNVVGDAVWVRLDAVNAE